MSLKIFLSRLKWDFGIFGFTPTIAGVGFPVAARSRQKRLIFRVPEGVAVLFLAPGIFFDYGGEKFAVAPALDAQPCVNPPDSRFGNFEFVFDLFVGIALENHQSDGDPLGEHDFFGWSKQVFKKGGDGVVVLATLDAIEKEFLDFLFDFRIDELGRNLGHDDKVK